MRQGKEEDEIVPAAEPAKLHVETDPAEVIAPSCSHILQIVSELDIMICAMHSFTTRCEGSPCTEKENNYWQRRTLATRFSFQRALERCAFRRSCA